MFGARRSSTWQGAPSAGEWQAIIDTSRRGFTGHEHLDNVSLIHMNGRVYDPALGRFTSADPLIDGPFNSQGWNHYAYVHNRPLSATDPSGYSATSSTVCVADARARLCWRTVYLDAPISGGRLVDVPMPNLDGLGQILDSEPSDTETVQPQEDPDPINRCELGNTLAKTAEKLNSAAGRLTALGLGLAGLGVATGVAPLAVGGMDLAALGGGGSLAAGGLQLVAGVLQGSGGGGYGSTYSAAVSVTSSMVIGRAITGPAASGYRTVSQREGDSFARDFAIWAGGAYDLAASHIPGSEPTRSSCPGGK